MLWLGLPIALAGAVVGIATQNVGVVAIEIVALNGLLFSSYLLREPDSDSLLDGWVDEDKRLVADIVGRYMADEFGEGVEAQAELERLIEKRMHDPVRDLPGKHEPRKPPPPPPPPPRRESDPPPGWTSSQQEANEALAATFGVPTNLMSEAEILHNLGLSRSEIRTQLARAKLNSHGEPSPANPEAEPMFPLPAMTDGSDEPY
jgi:hypothetical protein